jgi:hypothetical protein
VQLKEGRKQPRSRRKTKRPDPSQKLNNVPGTDRWEVEAILDYRLSPGAANPDVMKPKRMVYFAVKWLDYPEEVVNLEPVINLLQAMNLVKKFLAKRGKKLEVDPQTEEAWLVDLPSTK